MNILSFILLIIQQSACMTKIEFDDTITSTVLSESEYTTAVYSDATTTETTIQEEYFDTTTNEIEFMSLISGIEL